MVGGHVLCQLSYTREICSGVRTPSTATSLDIRHLLAHAFLALRANAMRHIFWIRRSASRKLSGRRIKNFSAVSTLPCHWNFRFEQRCRDFMRAIFVQFHHLKYWSSARGSHSALAGCSRSRSLARSPNKWGTRRVSIPLHEIHNLGC